MNPEHVFKNELALIQINRIREFTLLMFDQFCPPKFWTVPASSTGTNHPKYAQGEGGLVRHTISAVYWGTMLFPQIADLSQFEEDVIVSSLLLHDLYKGKVSLNYPYQIGMTFNNMHGLILGEDIYSFVFSEKRFADIAPAINMIIKGIKLHMGRWTYGFNANSFENQDPFVRLIHLADYIAAQKIENHPYWGKTND